IQELSVPAPLRRLMEEVITTAAVLHDLPTADPTEHEAGPVARDPFAIDEAALEHSLVVALFGDDGAAGSLELTGDRRDDMQGDGALRVRWPQLRDHRLFTRQLEQLSKLSEAHLQRGGRVLPNPLWRPLTEDMRDLIGGDGPLLTVHPLGGCAMADDAAKGVVDDCGRVFCGDGSAVHDGLVVLDGAIVPRALGINPALTIAALALRALSRLRREWGLGRAHADRCARPLTRPRWRTPPVATAPVPTEIEVVERMHGDVVLIDRAGARKPLHAEVTLRFGPVPVRSLMPGVLPVAEGWLRLYDRSQYRELDRRASDHDRRRKAAPQLELPLAGNLHLFEREASSARERCRRARCAYLRNRGLRDAWDGFVGFLHRLRRDGFTSAANPLTGLRKMIDLVNALATRAGEVRTLRYELKVTDPQAVAGNAFPKLQKLTLRKRLTYAHRANPWQQLMEAELRMEGLAPEHGAPLLELDPEYFASEQAAAPLVRVVRQQDQPSALADLGSFALYLARMLATIHFWSLRKPDAPGTAAPNLLPGPIARCAAPPEITELEAGVSADGAPVRMRLTRYRRRSGAQPVLLIHGYSASGTTFTHPAVRPSLARYLWDLGFDVWVADLRTSAGLPSARLPWSFEDVACADIPLAVDHLWRATGQRVDVVAHCMGAAMFGMAVLLPPEPGDRFFRERAELPQRVRRAVLSQVGPALQLTPANTLRGFVMRYLRHMLPATEYAFRPAPAAGRMDALLDRLLATLPYPRAEWDIANPPWAFWRRTPWLTTRLRMDALFGRVFNLENVPRRVLAHIDDLFGRINLETAAQPIQFAQWREITLRDGRRLLNGSAVGARWTFPTLSLHAENNGLADFATKALMEEVFRPLLTEQELLQTVALPGVGHQDVLLGTAAARMPCFDRMARFLLR
ncbi:MAG TPA: GMC oxidoreductase, partial [Burkholderiaceae bacterium]|nr:GMC oxidoreductase [Burkholderiaceae bacterium]